MVLLAAALMGFGGGAPPGHNKKRKHLRAQKKAGFVTGTFLQQSPPSKEIVFVNIGLTYRF